ncbi:HNH endonuclease signature motif containing protein [Leifsonia bigeumensis]|uniref:HNH endonuclease signature motif containing protein n=1 Tax=Leifsonella bigeumensis TaxID=433643 RepID=A0ABP7FS23_9MICO
MESIRIDETSPIHADAVQEDFDAEFDAMVASWSAERWLFENGESNEAQECIDALLEARAIKASAEAREQQCLARLEALALESAEAEAPSAHGDSREIAWRSMAAEIAVATRMSDRTVQAMMGRATALVHTLPSVLDALGADRISFGHARVILEHAVGIEPAALDEYQRITLERAEETTPGRLAATAKIAAARLRAESFEERHARAREGRKVTIRDLDGGMSELVQVLPTVYAAAVFDRLTRQAKAVAATGDPRTRDQLRADLAMDLLLTGEPACGEDAPHTPASGIRAEVAILIPAFTLLGESDEPATLLGRGPIDLDTACRLASQAPELVRVLTDPVTGMVINADNYRPTSSLRRYLEQRDRHCGFPVCNRDARYTDIDHTIPWEHGGRTVPGNLACLCRGHHTLKHHGGWTVKQTSPGILEWTSPLGRVVSDAAPPGPRFEPEPPPDPALSSARSIDDLHDADSPAPF